MLKYILAVVLICLTTVAFAQSVGALGGEFWNNLTREGKIVFLIGLNHGENLIIQVLNESGEELVVETVKEKTIDMRSISDIIASIDKFYEVNPDKINWPIFYVYSFTVGKK